MKIIFVTPFFYPIKGGMEEHVLQIAKQLIKKGHEVSVFTSDLSRNGKIRLEEEVYENIRIKRFKTLFKIGDFASFFPGIFREIRKSNADLVHVHGYRHPTNLIPLFTKKPCFMTLHFPNYPKGLRNKTNDIIIPLFDKLIGKYILKKYKKLITINNLEIEWLKKEQNIKENKIRLIPNGIPSDYLNQRNEKIFKNKYNIKNNDFTVLSLSRIHKSKGLDLTVKVAKYFPKIKFLIAGADSGHLEELKQLKENLKLNNVHFLGELDENIKLNAFKSSNIFLFPSHYEGFGIVILEAFSQKVPVLSSDAGPLPWVISNAGLIFKDNDLEDLKNKLKILISNKTLRNEYSNLGYERVKKFTWEKIVDNLEEEYKK